MPDTIRALLVNATTREITEVHYPRDDIHAMHRFIECDCFDAVRARFNIDGELVPVTLWVDDEGALKGNNPAVVIGVQGYHLAGNVLVTGGVGPEGETLDLPEAFTVDMLKGLTLFGAPPVIPRPWTITVVS